MKKFAIVYGENKTELQKRAIEELSTVLLDYTAEFPLCLPYCENFDVSRFTCIFIGTKENHPYISRTSKHLLTEQESYAIRVTGQSAVIEGFDDAGVLYGVLDFYNHYITQYEYPDAEPYWVNFLERDTLPEFEYSSAPSVKERGLWTWGHVIYDYRGYLDHMMKLKMNRIIIWNDFAPANAKDIIEYAHARNIQVIWGFSWLWDNFKDLDITCLDGYSEKIFEKYLAEYADLNPDGIYFQTFTETSHTLKNGILIAEAATTFVNQTAALFYRHNPKLEIQFGLHADSVKNHTEWIQKVDPRIRIVWENCGAFPFSYVPKEVDRFEETQKTVQAIANLRGKDDRFGAVTKGLVCLDWAHFEHRPGALCVGVGSEAFKQNRIERKRKFWRYAQAYWLIHADKAYEMIRQMNDLKNGNLCLFALVEDGMFEENILFPVALYSEMLWDCHKDVKDLISEVALRSYLQFG